jgi:hypothetical protein
MAVKGPKTSAVALVSILLLFSFFGCTQSLSHYHNIRISKFKLSQPEPGTYTPWNPHNRIGYFAGEVIIIQGSSFRYTGFSDTGSYIPPDYKGEFSSFADHIYLNDSRVPSPFRVAGIADEVPVLLTRAGYEQWQKTGSVAPGKILYLQNAK